jgi:hypothetical protein
LTLAIDYGFGVRRKVWDVHIIGEDNKVVGCCKLIPKVLSSLMISSSKLPQNTPSESKLFILFFLNSFLESNRMIF